MLKRRVNAMTQEERSEQVERILAVPEAAVTVAATIILNRVVVADVGTRPECASGIPDINFHCMLAEN